MSARWLPRLPTLLTILAMTALLGEPAYAAPTGWRRLDTDHFVFIYKPRDREAMSAIAAISESVYERVTGYLQYEPREPVPVVVYGDTAIANGFFTPYPPHISLFVSSPSGPWLGASTGSWLETLFVHELIHYVHLTRPIGFFGRPSKVFGPLLSAASLAFAPGWFIEGPTTFGEGALASGGRGDNPFFEKLHVAPILEGRMYHYDQAGFMSDFAPSGRIYAAGYLMVDHLISQYGDEAFVELNRAFQRAPMLGMRRAIRRTTGVSAPDFYNEMLVSLEAEYNWRRALPSGTVISPPGRGDWTLPVATERGLVAFGRGFAETAGLYLLPGESLPADPRGAPTAHAAESDSGARQWKLMTPVLPVDQWSWSIDRAGYRAVVAIFQAPASGRLGDESASDLFLIELDDPRRPKRLTRDMRLFHPALSPDGRTLVAVQRVGSYARIVSVDILDGTATPIYAPETATLYTPAFSPDGRFIAVTENRFGRQWITVIEADSGQPLARVVDHSGGALYFPRFAEAGSTLDLWFGGDRDNRLALYRGRLSVVDVDADTTALEVGRIERVIDDQVAAFGGFPLYEGTEEEQTRKETPIVYAGYTADGYVVKLGKEAASDGEIFAADGLIRGEPFPDRAAALSTPRPSVPLPSEMWPDGAHPGERRYRDIPRPILWVPQVVFRSSSDDRTELDLGVFLIGASNLGHHDVNLSLTYNPWAAQPTALLSYTYASQGTNWVFQAGQDYSTDLGDQTTTISLLVQRPLLLQHVPGFTRAIVAGAGIEYRNLQYSPDESGFLATLQADDRLTFEEAEATVSIRFARSGRTAIRDFYGPPGRALSVEVSIVPELLDNPVPRVETTTQTSLTLRAIGAVQLVPTAVVTTSSAGNALGRLPYLGGGFEDRRTTGTDALQAHADVGWLGRLQLRIPLGTYDAAWRGLASTGTGMALYVEQGGAITNQAVTATASTVVGTELSSDLFFNMLGLRLTGGAAVRLPHPGSQTDTGWLAYARVGL